MTQNFILISSIIWVLLIMMNFVFYVNAQTSGKEVISLRKYLVEMYRKQKRIKKRERYLDRLSNALEAEKYLRGRQ